jgi:hypothetical protein
MGSGKTYEGAIVNGQIRLDDNISLPDCTKVYVLIPETSSATVHSPRLVHPGEAAEFVKEVKEFNPNAQP